MGRKMLFFVIYVLTGIGMMTSALMNEISTFSVVTLLTVAVFFIIALSTHFKDMKS